MFSQHRYDLVRHAMPLVNLYVLDGSVPRYLLMTAFNLALGLLLIVALTRAASDPTTVDARAAARGARFASAVTLSLLLGLAAAFICVPIFGATLIFGLHAGVEWRDFFFKNTFWVMVALMCFIAGLRAQLAFEAVTVVGARGTAPQAASVVGNIDADRARSRAQYAAQVLLILAFVFLSFALTYAGEWGFYVMPLAFVALQVFCLLKPDWALRLLPDLGHAEPAKPARPAKRGRRK